MEVTKEQLEPCAVELSIHIDADQVRQAYGRAYRECAPITRVPGFRPGKAPRAMLERYVNHDLLKERVTSLLVGTAYRKALSDEGIRPFGEPDMELSDLAEGQPFSFKATVYLPPRVELGDYSSVSVERPVVTVTDADVDEEVERTRREFARLVPVEGRGIQEHDWVIGDLLIEMEGQSTPPEPRRTLIRLGDNIPGFDEAILGMAVGDERTFTLVYPEDHQDENLRGKPATFTLKVGSIQERILPEVSDVWVRMTLGLPNVEEWRAVLRERLQQSAREVSQRLVMDRIVEELISRSTVEYPRNMLLDTAQEELNDMREQLGERGITLEQYMRANNLTRDQLEKDILDRAAHQLKAQLVLAELAKKEQVRVTQEEIDAEFDALLANADASDPSVKRLRKSERRREQVGNRILRRKVTDCLLRIATITDVELTDDARQPSEAAPPSEPGGKEQ